MTLLNDNSAAVVVLPAVYGRLHDRKLLRWLAQSSLEKGPEPRDLLASILGVLGKAHPQDGLGAMRMWGQTSDRPTVWIAAADPVYLEPRLDHLCLHALHEPSVSRPELRSLFDHLQETLAENKSYGFARLATYGYLRAEGPIATASVPPSVVHLRNPNDYLPTGEDAADFRRLQSEIEMALHDHPVNVERQLQGLQPVNSLWLWGGGHVPKSRADPHPPLFTDDPLLRGYWESVAGAVDAWPGTISACLGSCPAGFVAVVPSTADDGQVLKSCLHELHDAVRSRRLRRLSLLFADGIVASVGPTDRMRFWRRKSALLSGDSK